MKQLLQYTIVGLLFCTPALAQQTVIPLVGNSAVSNSNPMPVTPISGGTAQDVNVTKWSGTALGVPTTYGTPPTGSIVPGVNASVTSIAAGSNIIGKVGIDQTTPGTTNLVQAGSAFKASPTITVSTTPAYSIGDSLGGLIPVTITNNNGQTGFLVNVRITDVHADLLSLTVFLFDANPTGVGSFACTDNAAYVNDPGVVNSMIAAPQNITLAVPTGATYSYGSVDFTPPRPFIAGGSTASGVKTIYACIVTNTSFTANATTNFYAAFGAALN